MQPWCSGEAFLALAKPKIALCQLAEPEAVLQEALRAAVLWTESASAVQDHSCLARKPQLREDPQSAFVLGA